MEIQDCFTKIPEYMITFRIISIQIRQNSGEISKKVPTMAEVERAASKSEQTFRRNAQASNKSKKHWSFDFYNKAGAKGEMPGAYKVMFYGAAVGYLFWRTLHLEATVEGKMFLFFSE